MKRTSKTKKFEQEPKEIMQLERERKKIDQLDAALLKLMSKRFACVKRIGKIKIKLKLPLIQKTRWQELLKLRLSLGQKIGLSPKLVKNTMNLIHKESLALQQTQRHKKG